MVNSYLIQTMKFEGFGLYIPGKSVGHCGCSLPFKKASCGLSNSSILSGAKDLMKGTLPSKVKDS